MTTNMWKTEKVNEKGDNSISPICFISKKKSPQSLISLIRRYFPKDWDVFKTKLMKAYLPGNEFWLTDIFEHVGNLFYTPKEQRFLLQVQNYAAGQRLQ